jgi:Transposase DDE domain
MSATAAPAARRQHLHFDAVVQRLRQRFEKLPEQRRCPDFSLADTLMAGLALFALKDPSLLAFSQRALDHNLCRVFGLQGLPSDTQMRCILDGVDPVQLRPAFRDVFRLLQRGKVLEQFVFLQGCYLISLDGVEYFCSDKVHCDRCLTRQHNGQTQYYHQMLAAALVHPDFSEVIPLAPEPIQREDGQSKNDCERNAARRWLKAFRREHPHLPVIITEDALSSNAPHIRALRAAHCHFILGVKPGDHKQLFEQVYARVLANQAQTWVQVDASTGSQRQYLFVENVSINQANQEVLVHFLRCLATDAQGQEHEWTWVTDLQLTQSDVGQGARGGRARWRIENETFNTLKNQGYHFEHNYGHGYKHLTVVFTVLMMLAFLVDQVQQKCNPLFRLAWDRKGSKKELWEAVRHLFASFAVSSMQAIYEAIAYGYQRPKLESLLESATAGPGRSDTS